MKREIKFRAWYEDSKHMDYSDNKSWGYYGDICLTDYYHGECELMQYTGLKDKNGKEIYEGDIVTHERCQIGVVEWIENRCGFYVAFEGINRDLIQRNPFKSVFKMKAFKWEVIGNIHENPELI